MGDSPRTTRHTNPGKKSAPPLFENDPSFRSTGTVCMLLLQQQQQLLLLLRTYVRPWLPA